MDIERDVLTVPVRRLLGDSTAEVEEFSLRPLGGGFTVDDGSGLGTARVEGRANSAVSRLEFRLVVKRVAESEDASADHTDWNYWKREPLAYASGVLETLPPGIAAPACYGVDMEGERGATLFMEDVPEAMTDWTLGTYRRAAEGLGRFNGAYLAGRPRPEFPWMLPGRTGNWLARSADLFPRLRVEAQEPLLAGWLSKGTVDRTMALWDRSDELLTALRSLPVCLCHHDAFRRNLIFRADGDGDMVAVDWSMIGPGAVGEELAPMVGVTLQFMDVEMAAARDLETAVYEGYIAGLRRAGWTGPGAEVRLGFTAATSLLMGLGTIGGWLSHLRDVDNLPLVEQVIGKPIKAFMDNMAELHAYSLDLGDEALSFVGA